MHNVVTNSNGVSNFLAFQLHILLLLQQNTIALEEVDIGFLKAPTNTVQFCYAHCAIHCHISQIQHCSITGIKTLTLIET